MAARAGALAAQRAKRKKSRTKSSRTMSKSYNNNNNIDIRKKELTVEYKNKLKKYHEESKSNSVYNFQIPIVYHMLKLKNSFYFQHAITGFIFLAAIMVAVQTYPTPNATYGNIYKTIDALILWVFVLEIVVKLLACGKIPWKYFNDNWNRFDFIIVLISFVPLPTSGNGGGGIITAFRLLRLLRVLKLVKALPKLRILIIGLFMSLNSIGYIGFLLILNFYLFSCAGVGFFGKNDPVFMGDVFTAMLTLFRCSTLEDWTDVMYIAMYGCENYGYDGIEHLCTMSYGQPFLAAIYFVAFIIISSMMVMNLFIGIIASSVEDAKHKLDDEALLAEHNAHHPHQDGNSLTEMVALINKMALEIDNFGHEEKSSKDVAGKIRRLDTKDLKKALSKDNLMMVDKEIEMVDRKPSINRHRYIAPPKTPLANYETNRKEDEMNSMKNKKNRIHNNNNNGSPYVIISNNNDDIIANERLDLEVSIKNGFVSPNVSPKYHIKNDDKTNSNNEVSKYVTTEARSNNDNTLETSIDDIEKEIANSPLNNKTMKNNNKKPLSKKLNSSSNNDNNDLKKRNTKKKKKSPPGVIQKQDMKAHLLTKVFDKKQLKRINNVIDPDAKLDEAIQALLDENDSEEELD